MMKVLNYLKIISHLFSSNKYVDKFTAYESISELPIRIWTEVYKTGNLSLLIKTGECADPTFIWHKLHDQYLDRYGISDDYEKYVDKLKELTILIAEHIITGDRFLLNKINMLKIDLKEIESKTNPLDLKQAIPTLEKHYKIEMDDNISVQKFYDRLFTMYNLREWHSK